LVAATEIGIFVAKGFCSSRKIDIELKQKVSNREMSDAGDVYLKNYRPSG
jgi:hypothetical protein